MATTFQAAQMSENPRDWKGEIGLMNIQKTNVVFTLESLTLWLKTLQIEVDPNLSELKNLPKFAQLGNMLEAAPSPPPEAVVPSSTSQENATPPVVKSTPTPTEVSQNPAPSKSSTFDPNTLPTTSPVEGFIPSRRVREPIGGGSKGIASIFGGGDEDEVPYTRPPNPTPLTATIPPQPSVSVASTSPIPDFVPTRKVRQLPGGGSAQISAIFG